MSFIDTMQKMAKREPMRLALPEGTEPRTIRASRLLIDQNLAASVTLLGCSEEVERAAQEAGCDLEGVSVQFPERNRQLEDYAQELWELRKHKGIRLEEARAQIVEPLNWGAMMVRKRDADAMVAGAESPTASVLRSVFTIIGTQPGVALASSYFVMHLRDSCWGQDGYLLFSDCATIPNPDAAQLCEIAITSAESFRNLFLAEPRVALLSFSTYGSASHEMVEKVVKATVLAQSKRPDLLIDGELQLDAALVPSVAKKKAPGSPVAGRANVLIFPDLNSGNIGYKLVQRLAGAAAYGPFLQGLARPASDLSRGCSVEDIVNTSVVTMVQAQRQKVLV